MCPNFASVIIIRNPRNMKILRTKFYVVCLAAALASCGSGEAGKAIQSPAVRIAEAEAVAGGDARSYTFISRPCRVTELAFRVGGPVNEFDVQGGQFFRKGELIAAIDQRDFIIRRDRAEALCRRAEADFRRTASLYEKNNVSAAVYEQARADFARAKADYDMALNDLRDTRLVAPFDGYVQQAYIERHQELRASQPVVTFIDLSQVKVEAYVPEDMAVGLRGGAPDSLFAVRFDRLPGHTFTPAETYLTQTAASNNLSYRLTALIDNKDQLLLGGMAGTVLISLPSNASTRSLAVPQAALCHDGPHGTYVWRLDGQNRVAKVPVLTGRLLRGNRVEIASGLAAGDRIAVSRLAYLSEGEPVQPEPSHE